MGGGCEGEFRALDTRGNVKEELTTPDIPELNGVAERQMAIIEAAGHVARIQTSERYPNEAFPKGDECL